MTTYLGKSCSFGLPRVPFVNCGQFMYLVISLLVLRAGCGICLYQFLIIAYLFTLQTQIAPQKRPKTSFEIRASSLYVFEICLSFETSLWRQKTSFNDLCNVAGFHDVIDIINVQNIYKTVQ